MKATDNATNDVDTNERRLTPTEAAKMLGLKNSRAVTRLCHMKRLVPAYKIVGSWQIPESSIKKYLERHSNA